MDMLVVVLIWIFYDFFVVCSKIS